MPKVLQSHAHRQTTGVEAAEVEESLQRHLIHPIPPLQPKLYLHRNLILTLVLIPIQTQVAAQLFHLHSHHMESVSSVIAHGSGV